MQKLILVLLLLSPLYELQAEDHKLSLEGSWGVCLDSLGCGESEGWQNRDFPVKIDLPGTTDEAGLGIADTLPALLAKPQLTHLTRRHSYVGPAWYTRTVDIPASAAGKRVTLSLERILWKSDLWIDGVKIASAESSSLVAPHVYDITRAVKPGHRQRITLRVDNRRQYDISYKNLAHAYTDDTQTIWNGVIGEMSLTVGPVCGIGQIAVFPNTDSAVADVKVSVLADQPRKARLTVWVQDRSSGKEVARVTRDVELAAGSQTLDIACPMRGTIRSWSEFSPQLYSVTVKLKTACGTSVETMDFGMRKLSRDGQKLILNGAPLFLRGTLECCIFPLTGHPPMDRPGWEKVIRTAKAWGLNHLRFHSWCPPRAAFEVADREGFYLQVELPLWSLTLGKDPATTGFLQAEARRIIDEYGNHPSFCFMSMGNELQGDMSMPNRLMRSLKAGDSRRLYTTTSFTFEKGYGAAPMEGDDFLVTQWTKDGWVRGQGVFNSHAPAFDRDFSTATQNVGVPLVTHEIGQYSVYPDLREIGKYTGVLRPLNFEAVRADLEAKGLLGKAPAYTRASGKLAAVLYKEEIERALKTTGISGFQLLDLHDFPGQGTALVGLLDAFWESKGVISAADFREFCAPVVLLARFPKATYSNGERFSAILDVSNYSDGDLPGAVLKWRLTDSSGTSAGEGSIEKDIVLGYNSSVAKIGCDLSRFDKARKLTLWVEIEGTSYKNHWNIWVYPETEQAVAADIVYTRDLQEALSELDKGKKVLFNPDWKRIEGIEGKFVPVFWSPVHFPKQAATMGVLCEPAHPALALFPNDGHSDWQWWDLCINSTTMIADSIRGGSPIVEVVDNFVNNRRLAMIYEGRVGAGRLIIASCDLSDSPGNRIVARQMKRSLIAYMQSERFDPAEITNPEVLLMLASRKSNSAKESATSIY